MSANAWMAAASFSALGLVCLALSVVERVDTDEHGRPHHPITGAALAVASAGCFAVVIIVIWSATILQGAT